MIPPKKAVWGAVLLAALGIAAAAGLYGYPEAGRTFTEDERAVLAIPKSDAEAKRRNYALISRTAEPAERIEVRDCVLDPVVPSLKQGQRAVFHNRDKTEHSIEIDRDHIYRVPPEGELEISAVDFGGGAGIYGCACDQQPAICGLFLVTD